MISLSTISRAILANAFAAGLLAAPSFAQEITTDIGTLDKEAAEKVFPDEAALLALRGAQFPDAAVLRRHAPAHLVLDGRGRVRRAARPEGCLSFRQGRRGHRRPAASAPSSRGRSISWWCPTTPTGWASSRNCSAAIRSLLATPQGRKWYDVINSGKGAQAAVEIITSFGQGQMPKGFPTPGTPAYRSAWRETIKAAEEANEPGRFTAFIGYEWTSNAGGNNLHRNVIFRDDGAKASLVEPFTTLPPLGSDNPRDLWKWMATYEEKTGGRSARASRTTAI